MKSVAAVLLAAILTGCASAPNTPPVGSDEFQIEACNSCGSTACGRCSR